MHALIVHSDKSTQDALTKTLTRAEHTALVCESYPAAKAALDRESFDVVLAEQQGDVGAAAKLLEDHPELPVIAVLNTFAIHDVVDSFRHGADDVIARTAQADEIVETVSRIVDAAQHHNRTRALRLSSRPPSTTDLTDIVGQGPSLERVREQIRQFALLDAPVLIVGETGTEKERVARAIHDSGPRHSRPWVSIDCSSMSSEQLERALLGNENRSLSQDPQRGGFRNADGGTLFVDEIDAMPLDLQSKFQRTIHERHVRSLGASTDVPFDVRIITANSQSLLRSVAQKRFREDLMYRLDILRIELPPLRDRGDDLVELAKVFLHKTTERTGRAVREIDQEALDKLHNYDWPGNVKELETAIRAAVAIAQHDTLRLGDLPESVRTAPPRQKSSIPASAVDATSMTIEELQGHHVRRVLQEVGGNRSAAAHLLGVHRSTLYRWMKKHGLA